MKYLKSYLESNQMIDEGDLETISNLFKFVEDELMLKRSEGTLEKNEYRIEIKNNKYGAAGNRIFIFAESKAFYFVIFYPPDGIFIRSFLRHVHNLRNL
jgi:hypothetical protein